MNIKYFYFFLFFLQLSLLKSQENEPLTNWNDSSIAAEERMDGLYKFIWNKLLYNYPDSAVKLSRELFQFAHNLENLKFQANAYNSLGMAWMVQGNSDSGIYYTKESLKFKLKRKDTLSAAGSYNNLGMMYDYISKDSLAIINYHSAISLALIAKDSIQVINSLNNLGNVYFIQGNFSMALECYTRSLINAQSIKDDNLIAQANGNIGNAYSELKEYKEAIPYFQKSEILFKKEKNYSNHAMAINNRASCHYELRELDTAEYLFNKSLNIYNGINDKRNATLSLFNLGLIYKERKDYSKALEIFFEVLEARQSLGVKEKLPTTYNGIASIYLNLGEINKAIQFGKKGLSIAEEFGSVANIGLLSKTLYKAYKKINDHRNALAMFELNRIMSDSTFSMNNKKAQIQQEFKYAYEKKAAADSVVHAEEQKVKDARIAEQEALTEKQEIEIKNKRQQQYFLFGGLSIVLIFAGFIFNRFQLTKKQKGIIEQQKDEVEEKNQEITDSIIYAKRLQEAILPPIRLVKEWLTDSFIFYKPKDIVAGDFYWMEVIDGWVYFAAADCTGHGVPGALVSFVCSSALSKALIEEERKKPSEILDRTRELVIERFGRSEEEIKDGMDISLAAIQLNSSKLQWAGANNPLWIIRNGADTVEEIKANKQPIGKFGDEKPFTNHEVSLNTGDTIYLFSDGFPDQFGGEKGKKYMSGKFKKLFLSMTNEDMSSQRKKLEEEFDTWKGSLEQLDDVCVIGVKIT